MQNIFVDKNFHPGTLLPYKEEDRKKFWNWRSNDIFEMFTFILTMSISYELFYFYNLVTDYNLIRLYRMYTNTVRTLIQLIFWFLGRRYKQYFNYLVVISYIADQALQVQNLFLNQEVETSSIYDSYQYISNILMISCFVLSPNVPFTLVYILIYGAVVSILYFPAINADFDEDERKRIITNAPIWVISGYGMFYLL